MLNYLFFLEGDFGFGKLLIYFFLHLQFLNRFFFFLFTFGF